jgi:dephospho-CoA kinase
MSHLKAKSMRPIRLGLTGSLASGKSTALKAFRKLGFKTLSADDVVAEIYKKHGLTKKALIKKYTTKAKLKKLEAWIHPRVEKHMLRWMRKQKGPVVVEVPLLFEAGFDQFFDKIIFIYAPRAVRLRRAVNRGMSPQLFRMLDKKQWSANKKEARADIILRNTSKKALKAQVKKTRALF